MTHQDPRNRVDAAINKAENIVPKRRRVVRRKVKSKEKPQIVVTIPIESKSNVTPRADSNISGTPNFVSDSNAPKSSKPEPVEKSETTQPAVGIAPSEAKIEEDATVDDSGDKAEEVSEKDSDRTRGVDEHQEKPGTVAKNVHQPDVEKSAPIESKVQTEPVSNTKPIAQNVKLKTVILTITRLTVIHTNLCAWYTLKME